MNRQSVRELEERIAELRRRIPPHSVPAAMLQELEELEGELEKLQIYIHQNVFNMEG